MPAVTMSLMLRALADAFFFANTLFAALRYMLRYHR